VPSEFQGRLPGPQASPTLFESLSRAQVLEFLHADEQRKRSALDCRAFVGRSARPHWASTFLRRATVASLFDGASTRTALLARPGVDPLRTFSFDPFYGRNAAQCGPYRHVDEWADLYTSISKWLSRNSSSSAFASFKSRVSNPSVNQP
jgi:hypothetical protein